MTYDVLMAKLASQDFKLNPNLQDVMQRVREVGLHKVAAQMHNVPEFNIRVAVENLGMQLCLGELRREKIASGLQAYNALVEVGEIRPLV